MLFGDSYIKLKLESCKLKGVIVCVCGMPQSPIVIFEHDGGYYTRCQSCSATLCVSAQAALLSESPRPYQGRDPGVWINYSKSDLFMVFYCICGNERQIVGFCKELPPCDVCRLQFLLPQKFAVRPLPRDYAFDCAPSGEGGLIEWSERSHFRRGSAEVSEAASGEVVSDLPDVSAKVEAFKKNPYHFLAATMRQMEKQVEKMECDRNSEEEGKSEAGGKSEVEKPE